MKSLHLVAASALVVVFVLSALAGPGSAAVVKKDLPTLVSEAQSIVAGKVIGIQSRWDGGVINTYVTVHISERMKGQDGGSDVIVTTPGGEVGEIGLVASESPHFSDGEEVVLFLAPDSKGALRAVGAHQGKMTVHNGIIEELGMPVSELRGAVMGRHLGKPDNPGKPPKHGKVCYKLCGYTWTTNGDFSSGKWSPGGGWWLSNNNNDGLSNSQVSGAVTAGASTWDGAGACWTFGSHNAGVLSENITDTELDGRNMVSFGATGGAVAVTYNWYYTSTPEDIIETDLVFDDAWKWYVPGCDMSDGFDLQNVATHEFGHWLCLDDQYGKKDAEETMYGYVGYGWCQQRTLHQCDIDGILAIYGSCGSSLPGDIATEALGTALGNSPNPFRSITGIEFRTEAAGPVAVRIYDVAGRLVRTMAQNYAEPGVYTIVWNGKSDSGGMVPPGVYFYSVETPTTAEARRMMLAP
jgi:hypothetical protein